MMKAKKNICILKHLSKFLPLKTLNQMYKALVRSHLDYCDIIYHMPQVVHQPPLGVTLHDLMETVEKVQYQAGLAITGCWKGSSRNWVRKPYLVVTVIIALRTTCLSVDSTFLFMYLGIKDVEPIDIRTFFPDAVSSWNAFISHSEYFPTYFKNYIIGCHRPGGKPVFGTPVSN